MAIIDYLNAISRNGGFSPRSQALSNAFYGLNMVGRNGPIPTNTENHGFTFFTRPYMNMSYDNLVIDRVLSNLLVDSPYTMQRMIRAYLDPTITKGNDQGSGLAAPGIDNRNAFLPLLSNNLINLNGWPDFTLNTHTSQSGLYRETYSYVDDIPYNYTQYDLIANFRNLTGDPISFLFLMWGWYMGLVYEGRIMPHPELVMLNEIDYNTRIYRLIMDPSRTYITRIGATGAAFPMTAPIGNIFNYEGDGSESPFSTANDQINIQFRCMGFTYYDPILLWEFNRTVNLFNPEMSFDEQQRQIKLVKLSREEREIFNFSAYPWINEATLELEWWVTRETYQQTRSTYQVDTTNTEGQLLWPQTSVTS